MGRNGGRGLRGRSFRLLVQIELQSSQLDGTRLGGARLQSTGRGHQPPRRQGSRRGPLRQSQQLELPRRPALVRRPLDQILKKSDRCHWAAAQLLQLLQLLLVHFVLLAGLFLHGRTFLEPLLVLGMLGVDPVLEVLDDCFLSSDFLHQCSLYAVTHVELEVKLVLCVLKPIQRRMATLPCRLLGGDHRGNLGIHVVLCSLGLG
mmetsp:Transcript_14208/g.31567  ORF Transcript_14208/g.31567 Transcript_14208/m.31567 type:complete len:204 (+) Transcript_14208:897-1508(+)